MHLMHAMLTSGRSDIDFLMQKWNLLQAAAIGGDYALEHSLKVMQLAFAANRLVSLSSTKNAEAQIAVG